MSLRYLAKKKKCLSGINNMIFKSITKVISNEIWEMWAAGVLHTEKS